MLPKQCNTAEEQAQTRRDDYRGKQCTTWVGMTLPSAPRHLLASALLPEMAQRFRVTSSTMVRAAIPTPGTAPVTGRYTRYGTLHPIRTGALPTDRVQHRHSQAQPRRASGSPLPTPCQRRPAANAAPPSPHSPIPHVIPRRPDALTPQKPQNSNVLT